MALCATSSGEAHDVGERSDIALPRKCRFCVYLAEERSQIAFAWAACDSMVKERS
jgi:hypothetical protein